MENYIMISKDVKKDVNIEKQLKCSKIMLLFLDDLTQNWRNKQ